MSGLGYGRISTLPNGSGLEYGQIISVHFTPLLACHRHLPCLDTIINRLWMGISQNTTQTLRLFLAYLERRLAYNRRNNVSLDFLVRVSDAAFLRSGTLFLLYPSSWPRPPPLRTPPLLAHPPTPLPALSLRAPALPRLPPDQRHPALP